MKVLVCGGRNYLNRAKVFETLDYLDTTRHFTLVIHGNARGADSLGAQWGYERRRNVTGVPAQWDKYGKKAGYIRNITMADLQPDLIVAFPGGIGTNMMIDIAKSRQIPIIIVPEE
jgi:hypothetical protein